MAAVIVVAAAVLAIHLAGAIRKILDCLGPPFRPSLVLPAVSIYDLDFTAS